jgi:hypothetical protein
MNKLSSDNAKSAKSVSENSVLWPRTNRGTGVSPAGSGGVPPPVPIIQTRSKTDSMSAVLCGVQECRAKPLGDPQRIIVVLAHPGCRLAPSHCRALRHRGALLVPAGPMDRNRVRFIKLLAHRTRVVPVLLARVDEWRRWNRRQPLTSAQIRRRTYLVVELTAPSSVNN